MKKNLIAIIPILLGLGCFVAFNIIGSEVDADGTLREPFGLIPIGWLLIIIGAIAGIILYIYSKKKK